jgi:hypothetical protein
MPVSDVGTLALFFLVSFAACLAAGVVAVRRKAQSARTG